MKESRSIPIDRDSTARELANELEAPFEMANLRPKTTGLPMTIWVSERGRAKHGPRVKVSLKHGDKIDMEESVTVTLDSDVLVIGGSLSSADLTSVSRYIALNRETLLAYWNGEIDTAELIERLQPVG